MLNNDIKYTNFLLISPFSQNFLTDQHKIASIHILSYWKIFTDTYRAATLRENSSAMADARNRTDI